MAEDFNEPDFGTYDRTDERQASVVMRVSVRLIPVMLLLYTFGYLDRINIGVAALRMNQDLGVTPAVFGLAGGLFSLTYTVFQVPSNLAIAKIGARRWLALIAVGWGAITVLNAYVRSANELLSVRFLLGIAEAGMYPGLLYYISLWFPQQLRSRVLFVTALPLAAVLGLPVSGYVVQNGSTLLGLSGWRLMFFLEGGASVLLGFATFWLLPSWPHEAGWLSPDEKRWLTHAVSDRSQSVSVSTKIGAASIWRVASQQATAFYAVAYACVISGFMSLLIFLPQMVASISRTFALALSPFQASSLSAVPYLFASVLTWFWTAHSDRTGERVKHCVVAAGIGAVGILLAAYSPNLPSVITGLILGLFGIFSSLSALWPLAIASATERDRPVAIAVVNTVGSAWLVVVPYVIGYLREVSGNYTLGILMLAIFLMLGGLMAWVAAKSATQTRPA